MCSCLDSLFSSCHSPFTVVMQMVFVDQEEEQRVSALQGQLQKSADEVASLTVDLKVAHSSLQVKQAPITLSDCDRCEARGCTLASCCTALLHCVLAMQVAVTYLA